MSDEPKRIKRLKHDTQPIPPRLYVGANDIQLAQLQNMEEDKRFRNESKDVLNQQSAAIEQILETQERQGKLLEPWAEAQVVWSFGKKLGILLTGLFGGIGAFFVVIGGVHAAWKYFFPKG